MAKQDMCHSPRRRKLTLVCPTCGTPFERFPSQIRPKCESYCSRECAGLGRTARRRFVNGKCEHCGAGFRKRPDNPQRFCSRRCFGASRVLPDASRIVSYANDRYTKSKIVRICIECGKEFYKFMASIRDGRGLYCSHECCAKGLSSRYQGRKGVSRFGKDNPNWRGKGLVRECPACGRNFRGIGKTCSLECGRVIRSQTISGENNPYRRAHPPTPIVCNGCSREYIRCEGGGRHYCSNKCYLKHRRLSLRQLNLCRQIEEAGYVVEMERTWDWLVSPTSGRKLRVDIYLPDRKAAIEYDGRQHREDIFPGCDLRRIRTRDSEKDRLLQEHGIGLMRVSGWPIDINAVLAFVNTGDKGRRRRPNYVETDLFCS